MFGIRHFAMTWTRREFLQAALTGAAVLPLAGKGLTTDVFRPRDPLIERNLAVLDELERASFEFFWKEADPRTGLVHDRALAAGGGISSESSIAATGFGLSALCIGAEHNYLPRAEIMSRVRSSLHFLAHHAPHVHGFLYHFVNARTGKRSDMSEISPIDTAILLCGVLMCREYFQDEQIRRDANLLYHRVNWHWALNGGNTFALAWTPESGFSQFRWNTYCESMMMYLLALGSPTHPIPAHCWDSINRPWVDYGAYHYISSDAPLFIHQYSHAWFDFRGKRDAYANYFENSVLATLAHRQFCQSLRNRFPSYSKDVWGITASDSCCGYVVWGGPPTQGPIDGTIVPSASAGSLPFVFDESMAVLKKLRGYYGDRIWKEYGFVDAFNPLNGWVSRDVLGIDLGISMLMAENARSQFVWNTFMRAPEAASGMYRAGFHDIGQRMPDLAKGSPQKGNAAALSKS
jgi:hypothetical protein